MWLFNWNKQETAKTSRKYGWNHENEVSLPESEFSYKVMKYHANLDSISEVDLRKTYTIPVYDQGQLGSCTSNGWIFCYEYEILKQNEPYIPMSRLMHYYCERKLLGTVNDDSGAQISTGAKVVSTEGVCLESLWPYDISKFSENPPSNCWDDIKYHKGMKVERVRKTIKDLKQNLMDGFPIVFGFKVYESFEQTGADGIVKMPDTKTEQLLGGHCVVCTGFCKKDGKDYFIIRNSWGDKWADGGYCYMPFEFLTSSSGLLGFQELCSDFWTIKLVKNETDPNVPLTNEQTLAKIKELLKMSSAENSLEAYFDSIRNLVVDVESKKQKTA